VETETIDYGQDNSNVVSKEEFLCQWIVLDCIFNKTMVFTPLKLMVAPGNHSEVTSWVPVTISYPNFTWLGICCKLQFHQSKATECFNGSI
jgi:hypothetical protein